MILRNFQRSHQTLTCSLLLLLSLSVFLSTPVSGNVIGFDFGSTFFKITLVKPGQPFSIVENTATKRKTETWLTITEDERIFGYDSLTESTKYPTQSYSQLHRFVGEEWNDEFINKMKKERFLVNEFAQDDRGLIGWKIVKKDEDGNKEENIMYTEELIAQLFKYGRKLAEIQAKGIIKDCVITIPSYYTPSQRRMINDAADIAGLSVLQLIHENTAAATMFGIDRLDTDKSLLVLFYNMGGMDTEVSLVRYSAITDSATNKSYEHIEVLAEAYDKDLGGQDLDYVIVNMLADRFNALKERQGKPDIRENARAMKRLLKEATKIKDILSANKQMQVKIGELQDYVSLLTLVERKEFEDAAEGFFKRVVPPIEEVIKKAGVTIEEIDQIELLGGGIRVPKIQEILQSTLKKNELGVHLNGDEAMCFGSAFIASNSSASFKVRKVFLTVHPQTQFSIHITPVDQSKLQSSPKQSEEDTQVEDQEESGSNDNATTSTQQGIVYEKNYVLYKKTDYLGQKKSLSLTYDTDMQIDVYAEDGDKKEKVVTYTVKGIDDAATASAKKENVTLPKVTLSFELSRSGLIQLNKAEAKVEETYFVEERQPKPSKSRVLNATNATDESGENNTTSSETTDESVPQTIKKAKKRTIPYPLSNIDKKYYGTPTLTNEQLKACRERLRWFEKRDEDKAKTDKAKNDFESVIYALRDWVNEDENIPFIGTADMQEEILHQLRESENWLEDEGYNAKYGDYIKKFNELDRKYSQVKSRKEEHFSRDSAVSDAKRKLSNYEDKMEEMKTKKPWITDEQKKDVLERLNETTAWLEDSLDKQKQIPLHEDPAFRVSELEMKLKRIEATYTRVNSISKPKDTAKDKKKKMPKNIKIDNMTFDGNSGDINWEDFIHVAGGEEDEEQDNTQQQQQDDSKFEQEQTKKPYDASEEDL